MELTSFGQRVRERRIEEQWSQEELARRAGISRNYLSQIERGVSTNLSRQVMQRLAMVLGLGLSDFFEKLWNQGDLPPGLEEFARKANLPAGDVEMLAQIRYRGKQPRTPDEWRLLYNAIRIATEET